ncbi:MAG TPA: Hpt domain-containing protein [Holophaga sp.]|jgi:HPt (histidine-containing phosphotransfer) domain-containing protein|nr:Hpt domain-containing protein [Holophaga sp.]
MNPVESIPPASGDVLDDAIIQQLLDLDDGNLGLLEEMFQIFKDDTPPRIQALEAALLAGDHAEMGDVAHAIKGASATMGAQRVRAVALALETGGRKGLAEFSFEMLLERLKAEFQMAVKALQDCIASKR